MKQYALAVVGAHGSGKTTFINGLLKTVVSENLSAITCVGEVARFCPYRNLGATSDPQVQAWIMRTQAFVERFADSLSIPAIFDRCLLDQFAYYEHWGGCDVVVKKLVSDGVSRYAKIVYLPPNPSFLHDDGLRPTDVGFQKGIAKRIDDILSEFCPREKIVRINPLAPSTEESESVLAALRISVEQSRLAQPLRASEVMDALLSEPTVNGSELVEQLIRFASGKDSSDTRRIQLDACLPAPIIALLKSGGFVS
jgi:predicted ATPase